MMASNSETHSTATASATTAAAEWLRVQSVLEHLRDAFADGVARAPSTPEAETTTWAVSGLPAPLQQRQVELLVPPDPRALDLALATPQVGIVVDADPLRVLDPEAGHAAILTAATALRAHPQRTLSLSFSPRSGLIESSLRDCTSWFLGLGSAHVQGELALELPGVDSVSAAHGWLAALDALEQQLGLAHGSVTLTLRIDSAAAARDTDHLLQVLRERVVATRLMPAQVLADLLRTLPDAPVLEPQCLAWTAPAVDALSKAATVASHRRGVLALAAPLSGLPVRDDPERMQTLTAELVADVQGLLRNGHDGVTLAHAAFADAARAALGELMPTPNQLERPLDWSVPPAQWEQAAASEVDEAGLRNTLSLALQILESALGGHGRIGLYNQLEDLHSGGLRCLMLWHWLQNAVVLVDGRSLDADLFEQWLHEELDIIRVERDPERVAHGHFEHAAALMQRMCLGDSPPEFPISHLSQGTDRK